MPTTHTETATTKLSQDLQQAHALVRHVAERTDDATLRQAVGLLETCREHVQGVAGDLLRAEAHGLRQGVEMMTRRAREETRTCELGDTRRRLDNVVVFGEMILQRKGEG